MAKRGQITSAILQLLVKLQATGETFWDFTYHPHKYVYRSLSEEMGFRESSIRSALSRLQKRGFIEAKRDNVGETIIKLSDGGKAAWLYEKLASGDVGKLKDKYVIVFFDIPEQERKIRDILRVRLKQFGFEPWQKSVWATDKDVFGLIKKFLNLAGLENYCFVLQSEKISNEK
ncbi:MAG: CRISPR-associated endonuclease Cas2 [Candidatus Woykebacteria bacterium RBG_16_43_9]|uniref:CRISPR-associated endonuclease Cas2 n=1 Tax=Candidatus Woykebacteria bacterium RBG_16_43_9 TaxID=1802596 RepID=A0A1G1WCF2_9BACT|nr:MAG: CRISPR-associated endonuclease Cas2 [Candidatus Woykebacteria bacterium RBG_16_43_9]